MLRRDMPPHSPAEAAFWALRCAYSSRETFQVELPPELKHRFSVERKLELKAQDRADTARALATFVDIDPADLVEVLDSLQIPEHREVALLLIGGAY